MPLPPAKTGTEGPVPDDGDASPVQICQTQDAASVQSPAPMPAHVSQGVAAARAARERRIHSADPEVREEALLDEALELSFPASDPIAITSYEQVQARARSQAKPKGIA